ncbi:DUF982 domain-containing protein [Chelativorans sp. Marseille-P2723]|uniref:DUF982 domain-containing protein n=1 Tax=Chelativorans sp. Marseille-P2723 TaxID=2709133 RepID=UPI00156F2A9A|nr:DUF982 domain-containing protein [Chelativorans sp. Marseille-P2723]
MEDVAFAVPVVLRMSGIGERKVATSFEALECLERDWPEWARGRRWRVAVRTCRDALEGWRTATEARRSFMKAAMRAGFVQPARPGAARNKSAPQTNLVLGLQ